MANAVTRQLRFSISGGQSKTITFNAGNAYSFLLVGNFWSTSARGICYLVQGYVSASRGDAVNLNGHTGITIDMTQDSNTIVVSAVAGMPEGYLYLIPLIDGTYSVS